MAKLNQSSALAVNRSLARAIRDSRQFKCGEITVDVLVAHYTHDIGGYSTGLHQHDCFELAHVVDGAMEYRIGNGGDFVNTLNAKIPGWVLMPPTLVHSRRVRSRHSTVLGIMLKMTAANGATALRINQALRTCNYRQKCPESLTWLKSLDAELGRGAALLPERLGNIIELIVLELFQAFFPDLFSAKEAVSQKALLPDMISAYMDEHLNHEISVDSLAAMYHLSPRHLGRVFTGHFGISPGQYLIRQRLKLCAHQLLNTDKQIKEIAADCGFTHQGYFIRQFLRHFGTRPSDYRLRG
jgi:AraC-like DNA-binding protein